MPNGHRNFLFLYEVSAKLHYIYRINRTQKSHIGKNEMVLKRCLRLVFHNITKLIIFTKNLKFNPKNI